MNGDDPLIAPGAARPARVVVLGCGSIGQAVVPLLIRDDVFPEIRNYLGTRWAGAVDWTPLKDRLELFPEVADALPDDPWQFDAFRANV